MKVVNRKILITFVAVLLSAVMSTSEAKSAATPRGCISSTGSWANVKLSQVETGNFRVTFDATPSAGNIDSVTGLSAAAPTGFTSLAAIVRFNTGGTIDARNGAGYAAASTIRYAANTTYHFIMDVNVATHTYNAYVMVGSVQTVIGMNLAFRSEQAAVTSLSYLSAMASPGSQTLCNVALSNAVVAPSITAQPVSAAVTAGQVASFAVAANGSGTLSYQWMKNGAAISGATSASYSTPATALADNGAAFSAVVKNAGGSVTSSAAMLTVKAPVVAPAITSQPASQSLTEGQSATFSVAATGTAPMTYQWMKNGAAMAGATASTFSTSAALSDNGASFSVVVGNAAGSVSSTTAILTVKAAVIAPAISSQPTAQTVTEGQTATFTVASTGTAPMNYQWSKNGSAIAGANISSYTTPVTAVADNGSTYSVTVSNSAGSATSNAATLTVKAAGPAPGCAISNGAWVNTAIAPQVSSFRVSFDATPSASNIDAVMGLSQNAAADFTSLAAIVRFNAAGMIDARNGAGYTTTPAIAYAAGVTYHFIMDVNLASHSYDAYVVSGGVQTTLGMGLAFRTEQGAVNSLAYLNSMTSPGSQTICNISVTAAPATAPSITSQPVSRTVIAGQTATFSVVASGTSLLSYQWTKNGAVISGATAATYTTPATTSGDNGAQFAVVVSNQGGAVTSNAATLTVSAATLTLNASATSLNFGSVTVGSNGTQNVTLTNGGNANVTISQVTVSGAGYTATGASGLILSPGQSTTVTATFAPAGSGSANGTLTVSSNATNSPSTIALTGTAVAAKPHTVTLTWNGVQSGVTGYNCYSSTTAGGPYTKLNSAPMSTSNYTESDVQSGMTYYWVVTALNTSGMESDYSNEVATVIP